MALAALVTDARGTWPSEAGPLRALLADLRVGQDWARWDHPAPRRYRGADCDDCGERPSSLCSNSCFFNYDNVCDDGDAAGGAKWDECMLGTDCADCGPRAAAHSYGSWCNDTCTYASDDMCDDGGPGHAFSLCALGCKRRPQWPTSGRPRKSPRAGLGNPKTSCGLPS